jgi:hypothetical protein
MNDTPQHIKELQLKIWLSKSPAERLMQFMKDNTSLFQFWTASRDSNTSQSKDVKKSTYDMNNSFSNLND